MLILAGDIRASPLSLHEATPTRVDQFVRLSHPHFALGPGNLSLQCGNETLEPVIFLISAKIQSMGTTSP